MVTESLPEISLTSDPLAIILAVSLGLFVGLEREYSNKPAGVRTFSLLAAIGCSGALIDNTALIVSGSVFVIGITILLGLQGLLNDIPTDDTIQTTDFEAIGLSLTTSASMFVTFLIGVLIGYEFILVGVILAVLTAFILALKEDLHSFVGELSEPELRSAIEFMILSAVVYPLLPESPIDPYGIVQPRLVWILVIAVSGIGFANYILVKKYSSRGFMLTAFLGGLVNSTAVVASLSRQSSSVSSRSTAIGSIILSNSAMCARNAFLAFVFIQSLIVALPLLVASIVGIIVSYTLFSDVDTIDVSTLESPFDLKVALSFGALFLGVLLLTGFAEQLFGVSGILGTQFLAGFVSSGTSTTTTVTLFRTESISVLTATLGIILGTVSSMMVKVFFATRVNSDYIKPTIIYTGILIISLVSTTAVLATV